MRKGRTHSSNSHLTIPDVAERYNTGRETIHAFIRSGELPAIRVGRFIRVSPEALEQFERKHTIGSPDAVAALLDLRDRVERRLADAEVRK